MEQINPGSQWLNSVKKLPNRMRINIKKQWSTLFNLQLSIGLIFKDSQLQILTCFALSDWIITKQFCLMSLKSLKNPKTHSQALPEVMKSPFLYCTLCVVVLHFLNIHSLCWHNFTRSFLFFYGNKRKYCAQRCLINIDAQGEWILWLFILMKQTEQREQTSV